MVKLSKAYYIPFDFRKGKTGNLVVPAPITSFWISLLNTRNKKSLYSCIMDCDWMESRLP